MIIDKKKHVSTMKSAIPGNLLAHFEIIRTIANKENLVGKRLLIARSETFEMNFDLLFLSKLVTKFSTINTTKLNIAMASTLRKGIRTLLSIESLLMLSAIQSINLNISTTFQSIACISLGEQKCQQLLLNHIIR